MNDIAEIKQRLPMPALLNACGVEFKDKNHIQSPFREDKTGSFSIFEGDKGWKFKDHGEGVHGDEIDFLEKMYGLSTKDAIERYANLAGFDIAPLQLNGDMPERSFTPRTESVKGFDWEKCSKALSPSKANKFASIRGYTHDFTRELRLRKLIGWSNEHNTICFPMQEEPNGKHTGMHLWFPERSPRFLMKGKSHPWWIGANDAIQVHIFESQFDAFAFMQLMRWPDYYPETVAVLITRSASSTKKVPAMITDDVKYVYLHPQNDPKTEEGLTPAEKWTKELSESIKDCRIVNTPREHKDLNDWLKEDATHSQMMQELDNWFSLKTSTKGETSPGTLPPIINATEFMGTPCNEPEQVIGGVLHRGGKLVIGGGSKGRKTWSLMALACAVSTGREWWGFPCHKGKALYVNFELADYACHYRLRIIEEALNVSGENSNLDLWNLRGYASDVKEVAPLILEHAASRDYSLIVLDPIYKLLGDRDENSAGDMTDLMNTLENVAVEVNSSIVFGHHYSKGGQADKHSMDRMSGSGVFSRDPDAIVSLTDHEENDCYVAECTLRNFAPVDGFGLRWDFPLLERDDELDPLALKKRGSAQTRYKHEDVLSQIPATGVSKGGLFARTNEETGMAKNSFNRIVNEAMKAGKIYAREDGVILLK